MLRYFQILLGFFFLKVITILGKFREFVGIESLCVVGRGEKQRHVLGRAELGSVGECVGFQQTREPAEDLL